VVTGRPADCVYATGFIGGLAWTPDGREILFAQPEMSGRQIVRVTASGTESPVAVAATPHESLGPSVSRSRGGQYYRLAFFSGQPDVALRMIDLASDRRAGAMTAVHAFCDADAYGYVRSSPTATSAHLGHVEEDFSS
jgi:hypothetical protein